MTSSTDKIKTAPRGITAADALLALRLIAGWTYFSALWRRLIIDYKLDPEAAGYVGAKFNAFLPNAFIIKPFIEFFVSHPELLWIKLVIFTLVEGVVGLALMLGFMTRAMGIAMSLLALGILLGAGWLGTTCLDEWQIGILGIAAGMAFAYIGGGRYSVDHAIEQRPRWAETRAWHWLSLKPLASVKPVWLLAPAVLAFGLALLTNQVFHGGLWGPLHNKSKKPIVEISDAQLADGSLAMTLFRVEGADVYGSFLIGMQLQDVNGAVVADWPSELLAQTPVDQIDNAYIAKIRPGPHGLILPLGAKARVTLEQGALANLPAGNYTLVLEDVSGATWQATVSTEG